MGNRTIGSGGVDKVRVLVIMVHFVLCNRRFQVPPW